MRAICGATALLVAGLLAASAFALNVPTLPTATVTTPTVTTPPVPTVTIRVPAPVPTTPVPTSPPPPVPPPTVPSTTVSAPTPAPAKAPVTTTAPTPGSSSSQSSPPKSSPSQPSSSAAPMSSSASSPAAPRYTPPASHTHASRGAARRASRSLRLHRVLAYFRLRHPARIRIAVKQLAPVCRTLRGFHLTLPKGQHAFHFPAARITALGTYQLVGMLGNHKLFSVRARRLRTTVKRGGAADVCRVLSTHSIYSLATPGTLAAASTQTAHGQLHVKSAKSSSSTPREAAPPAHAVAPREKNPLVRAVSLTSAPASLRPLLLTLLAIAIVLLTLAAAPQRVLPAGRAAAIVASRRVYFAAAGIWLLVVVAVVTAFA